MGFVEVIKRKSTIAIALTVVITGIITTQNIVMDHYMFGKASISFYNNYLIFKQSFFSLLENLNLYSLHRPIHWDFFKYSPTFALFFGLLAYLPVTAGLFIWNLLNGIVFYALWKVDLKGTTNKFLVWCFVIVEFVTNIQSSQSNGLMAGLMILSYVFLERKNVALATLMIVLSAYVKIFGIVAFAMFLFYPDKLKAIGYALLWAVILFVLPLLVISPTELIEQYQNWWALLKVDKPVPYSLSVMGWLKYWFNVTPSGGLLTGIGVILFLVPFVQIKKYNDPVFRQLILASVLMWVVLFNHKAESPTFIIAIAGVAIWYFAQPKNTMNLILLFSCLVFTQLNPTDLFPSSIRSEIFVPYVVKVFPVILIWVKCLFDSFWVTED